MLNLDQISPEDVLEALKLWSGGNPERWPLGHLRLNQVAAREQTGFSSLAENGPAARNRALLNLALKVLSGRDPEANDLLRSRFEHQQEMQILTNRLNFSRSTLQYRQRQAVNALTDILNQMEAKASHEWRTTMEARLGLPTYEQLVGVAELQKQLLELLMSPTSPFIIALDGLGGIGKTALAHNTTQELLNTHRFEEIAWVTAKQTHLTDMGRLQVETGRPALTVPMLMAELAKTFGYLESPSVLEQQRLVQDHLRNKSCLIAIDNLESVADYRAILPELQKWQRPTKFLLTSRRRLIDISGVLSISLTELPQEAAIQLLRQEAGRSGFMELANSDTQVLQEIYHLIGGNPLALKLMIGRLRFYSLSQIIQRLQSNLTENNREDLFDYIYADTWESLGDFSKELLLGLTYGGALGFTFEQLKERVSIPEQALSHCLEDLILLSLVNVTGTLLEKRYHLHRLTELFLRRTFG